MQSFILLAVVVPTTLAVNCWIGAGNGYDGSGVYAQGPCGDGNEFCYKQDIIDMGVHGVMKGCGFGFCDEPGCDGSGLCCCFGDFCNAAPGGSLLMTIMAAAAAVLQRL